MLYGMIKRGLKENIQPTHTHTHTHIHEYIYIYTEYLKEPETTYPGFTDLQDSFDLRGLAQTTFYRINGHQKE